MVDEDSIGCTSMLVPAVMVYGVLGGWDGLILSMAYSWMWLW